jgi:hypothetical protein
MDPATLTSQNLWLVNAGDDFEPGTPDDFLMPNATLTLRESLNAVIPSFPDPLPFGFYELFVARTVADVAGNALTNDFRSRFAQLATGIDGDEDEDGLTNAEEILFGSNPRRADSDGDGWNDEAEFSEGTDPRDPASHPRLWVFAEPPLQIDLPSADRFGSAGAAIYVAQPPVQVDLPSEDRFGSAGAKIFVARPPVEICLPSPESFGSAGAPVFLARPPLQIALPSPDAVGDAGAPVHLAQPPVEICLPSFDAFGTAGAPFFLAQPPVHIGDTNIARPNP